MKIVQELTGVVNMDLMMNINSKEDDMEESIRKLRFDFEAETDITIDNSSEGWEKYARWLEKVTVNELNNLMVRENMVLRDKIQEAMDLLHEGMAGRID